MKDDAAGVEKNAEADQGALQQDFRSLTNAKARSHRRRRSQGLRRAGAVSSAAPPSVLSAAPPAEAVTPELIAAAKKEGKVVHYTSVDLPLAEKVAKAFEAKYPGIAVRVERSGAERKFTRIGQEQSSHIYACDVVQSSDASHFVVWKRDGLLAAYVPEEVAKYYPAEHKDPDGHVRELSRLSLHHRLQHQSGEGRGRAEELRRSARSEMGRQDRQGASGLQRHHPDRDLPDRPRCRLGLLREARQAARACRCSRRPIRRRSSRSASAR